MNRLVVAGVSAALLGGLGGCNLRDALTAHVDVVARTNGHELTVDRLAEIVAQGKSVALERDVVERVAELWIDYTLFAERIASGDSLLDSLSVVETKWADAQQQIVNYYHEQLVAQHIVLGDALVDSAFTAGDHRLIYHILIRAVTDTPSGRAEQRREAERLRRLVAANPGAWQRANEENDDAAAKAAGGSLGLLTRGATVPEFDSAAFALAPGEVAPVTETSFGYHVIRRPRLAEVREEFKQGVEGLLVAAMDAAFLRELEARWQLEVRSNAPRAMRLAFEDLGRAKRSRAAIGSYRGGRFTVADFTRWLQTLPVQDRAQLSVADDEGLVRYARQLVRNHVLVLEARSSGHDLNAADVAAFRADLAQELERLRRAMALDSMLAGGDSAAVVETAAVRYLTEVTSTIADIVMVPPFLADKLRAEANWKVSAAGVQRATERATNLRAAGPSIAFSLPSRARWRSEVA